MKKSFDIKYRPQIESGEYKVETREGGPARIICWDKKTGGADCIVALVTGGGGNEKTLHFDCHGQCISSGVMECRRDLFVITPEPEMSEFEKALSKCLCDAVVRPEEEDYDKWAKEYAPELFKLARKELIEEQLTSDPRKTDLYKLGKFEALKDLPRWRIWKNGTCGNVEGYPIAIIKSYGGYRLTDSLGVGGEKYIMLADLEKLPGFNEEKI